MKYLLTLLPLIFIGCDKYNGAEPVSYCKQNGYKGVANYTQFNEAYCSNGEIHGNYMLTSGGEKPLSYNGKNGIYKLIFTEFK